MTSLSRSRVAVASGLTLGTAVASLAFAPAAFAAPETLPALEVSSSTVVAGGSITVSGTACKANADYADAAAFVLTDLDEVFGLEEQLVADGTWSVTLDFPANTAPGEYFLYAGCDNAYYDLDGGFYPEESITVTAAGSVSTPTPTKTETQVVVTRAIRGAAANTAGITSTTKGSTNAAATAPGTQITKILKGFKPGEKVTVVLHSTPTVLGTFTADANGVVTATFTVPAGTAAGTHTLVFEGNQGSYFQEAFQVAAAAQTASSGGLAYTGADVAVPLALGGALVLAGGGALLVSRRRTAQAPQA